MRTVANPRHLEVLCERLQRVTPSSARQWGSMSAHQMLSHLGDGAEAVLGLRPFPASARPPRPLLRFVALWLPRKWPHGVRAGADPAAKELPADRFEADRARALDTMRRIALAPADGLAPSHPMFGAMRRGDWQRWAYLHTDHHLRQFGC